MILKIGKLCFMWQEIQRYVNNDLCNNKYRILAYMTCDTVILIHVTGDIAVFNSWFIWQVIQQSWTMVYMIYITQLSHLFHYVRLYNGLCILTHTTGDTVVFEFRFTWQFIQQTLDHSSHNKRVKESEHGSCDHQI